MMPRLGALRTWLCGVADGSAVAACTAALLSKRWVEHSGRMCSETDALLSKGWVELIGRMHSGADALLSKRWGEHSGRMCSGADALLSKGVEVLQTFMTASEMQNSGTRSCAQRLLFFLRVTCVLLARLFGTHCAEYVHAHSILSSIHYGDCPRAGNSRWSSGK